jgi:hypothetical protein
MDKVRYTSLKFKVWEDKLFKIEKQKQSMHLDEVRVNLMKQKVGDSGILQPDIEELPSSAFDGPNKKQHSFFSRVGSKPIGKQPSVIM